MDDITLSSTEMTEEEMFSELYTKIGHIEEENRDRTIALQQVLAKLYKVESKTNDIGDKLSIQDEKVNDLSDMLSSKLNRLEGLSNAQEYLGKAVHDLELDIKLMQNIIKEMIRVD